MNEQDIKAEFKKAEKNWQLKSLERGEQFQYTKFKDDVPVVDINPYKVETINKFIGDVNEEERDNKIKLLFKILIEHYDDLAKDRVIEYLSKKYILKVSTLNFIYNECKKSIFEIEKEDKDKINGMKRVLKLNNYIENVEQFWRLQPFFFDKSGLFWFWNKELTRWEIVDEIDVMNSIDKELSFGGETVGSGVKNNYLEAFKRVGRLKHPKDAPKKWIQFKDRAFSLKSGEIYEVTPDYFFCNPIPWEIGESEETPIIDTLFKEWVGDKYVDTLYEIIAYCCLTDYPIHLVFCLIGVGRNGKSCFQRVLAKFVGPENICSTELDTLLDSRFESAKLYKKLVCSLGETNFGVLSKTSLLKKLVGQDLIGYEHKNKNPFDDYNYAKIIINSNSLPTSEDNSEGFYRRWMIIDFPNKFPEGKDIVGTIPEYEYHNLARKITKILPKLLINQSFTNMGLISERKEKYIMASNPLSFYLKEYCSEQHDGFIRYSELYQNYVSYLKKINKRIITKREFTKTLTLEGHEIRRTSKKIGSTFQNDQWVEGLVFKDIQDTVLEKIEDIQHTVCEEIV